MYLNVHSISIGSFIGSILVLVFAVYSLTYIQAAFRTDRIIKSFFSLQISMFTFLMGHAIYSSSADADTVLFWTKICYTGAVSVITTAFWFYQAIVEKQNRSAKIIVEIITILILISLFLPGDHLFTDQLNPSKSYSSVIKGPLFLILVLIMLIPIAFYLFRVAIYIMRDKERRYIGGPVLISLLVWFTGTAYDGIFAAILSMTQPNLWFGPAAMAVGMGFFTARISEHRYKELEAIREEKEIIYRNLIHDRLTGVFTRAYITESLAQRKALQQRNQRTDSLLFIDIDNFKSINDDLGHKKGDEVLASLGKIFTGQIRQGDIPARLGGDEFLVLLDDCDDMGASHAAAQISKKFARELHRILGDWDKTRSISLSIGVVSSLFWGGNPEEIIHQADMAMYRSKKTGKNRISHYNNLD